MDITKDIQPMTALRSRTPELLEHLRATRRPVVLTVDGKAAAVIQDAESYQLLLDIAATASAAEGMRQGLDDAAAGRTRDMAAVFAELRAARAVSR